MSIVVRHQLPIKQNNVLVFSRLFTEGMQKNPIYMSWIPTAIRSQVLNKLFSNRLSLRHPESYLFATENKKSGAIVSRQIFHKGSWFKAWLYFVKYLPIKYWTCWLKLGHVAFYLRKFSHGEKIFYLESIVTESSSQQNGYASNILDCVEEIVLKSESSIICETHDGVFKNILSRRGWNSLVITTYRSDSLIFFMTFNKKIVVK